MLNYCGVYKLNVTRLVIKLFEENIKSLYGDHHKNGSRENFFKLNPTSDLSFAWFNATL